MSFEAPYWLMLLVPLGAGLWLMWRSKGGMGRTLPGAWRRVITPDLRSAMARRVSGVGRSNLPMLAAIIGLIVLALSRPVVGRPDLPDFGNLMGRVLVLDMSGQADASELKLVAERLVETAPDLLTGIVAVSAEAFVVVPLTTDVPFLLRYLRVLDTGMMPETGRALNLGISQAEQTLTQAGIAARQVVLISGGVPPVPGPMPSSSGSARYIIVTKDEAGDWSGASKSMGAEITPQRDAGTLAENLRSQARRRLAGISVPGVFRLSPVCLFIAAGLWLLLFRRRDSR